MTRRSRKLFSWTVITGLIFNLISPLFLLPWQQVWACFGSWDCGGNAYCAGAGSYPDHPGSCASYGERGNNDRTTSEIAQDYINNGGNPAEVVTRTQDFQGALSNNNAAAAAAAAQQLAAAEAQRIAAEQAAAANAAAAAAAAKAADDKAKVEAQRLAQEAAERSARAAANAAAAAAAMTAINAAAPAGTPAAGATVPAAAAIPASATGASCGSSSHNACSPNSDGNWYKCVNGSWQKYDDCKPAGAITCAAPACAGANGCIDEGVSAMYNGVEKVCGGGKEGEKGRWIDKSTVPAVKPQDPNPEEAMEIWLATEDGGLANRGSPLPTAVNSPTARPIAAAPTTAVAPPTSAPIPTAAPATPIRPAQQTAQEQVLEKFRCGEKGGTWTNDNTCQSPGRPSPTLVPNPTAIIGRPVRPTLPPTAVPTQIPRSFTPSDRGEERGGLAPTLTPIPTVKFSVPVAADREDRIQQPPETCRPGIVRNPDGTCANPTSNVKIETETVRVGGGVFGREVKVTTKTFCSGNSAVTQTSRSDGTESSDSKVCEWGCDGGVCRPPTIQETAVVRMEVINNAIDLAKVRCGQQGKKDCSTVSVYQDAMANMDPEEPSPYQVAIRNSGTTAVQRETLIQAEYNKLLREQVELASMGEAGAGMIAGPIDQAGLRQQAERKVDETIAAYKLSEGGGNTPAAVGRSLDKIGELSAEEAQGQIDQQGWLYGTIIAKPMFCGMNNNYRASGACGIEHASALNEEGLESARAYWTFLITGRTEQALQDIGMIIGDPRSPGFQGRDYNANVALPCGVRSSEGEEEVTDEELACLKGKNVEAQFRLAEVDQQNQTNAVLNVAAAVAGFAGGAIVGGAKAASLVGKAGLFLVREGMVPDVALSPLFAETTTAGQRAGADALAALATSPDLSQTEREIISELAAQADEEADRAYTENLLMNAASTVVIGAAGSGAGRVAREVFGETWLGRLLLGNLDVPAGRAAAAEVADALNNEVIAPASLFPGQVNRQLVSAEEVLAGINKVKTDLSGNTAEALAKPGVVAGANVPVGKEVGGAVAAVQTAARQNSGFIAEVKQGVGQIVSEGEIAITDVGRTLEKGVDNVVINAAETVRSATQAAEEAFDAAKINLTGKGRVPVEVASQEIVIRMPSGEEVTFPKGSKIQDVAFVLKDGNPDYSRGGPVEFNSAAELAAKLARDAEFIDESLTHARSSSANAGKTVKLDSQIRLTVVDVDGTAKVLNIDPHNLPQIVEAPPTKLFSGEAATVAISGPGQTARSVVFDPSDRTFPFRETPDLGGRPVKDIQPGVIVKSGDAAYILGNDGVWRRYSDTDVVGGGEGVAEAVDLIPGRSDLIPGSNEKPESFVEYLTGVKYDDPSLPQRMVDDHFAIKQKYGLPDRGLRFEDPMEYIRKLEAIADTNGIPVRDKSEFAGFFEEYEYAGAVYDDKGKQIFIDFSKDPIKKAGDLEHELIHALQDKKYPSMPFEVMEYEAYVGANTSMASNYLSNPDHVDIVFSLIGGSSNHAYKSEGLIIPWERNNTGLVGSITGAVSDAVSGATGRIRNAVNNAGETVGDTLDNILQRRLEPDTVEPRTIAPWREGKNAGGGGAGGELNGDEIMRRHVGVGLDDFEPAGSRTQRPEDVLPRYPQGQSESYWVAAYSSDSAVELGGTPNVDDAIRIINEAPSGSIVVVNAHPDIPADELVFFRKEADGSLRLMDPTETPAYPVETGEVPRPVSRGAGGGGEGIIPEPETVEIPTLSKGELIDIYFPPGIDGPIATGKDIDQVLGLPRSPDAPLMFAGITADDLADDAKALDLLRKVFKLADSRRIGFETEKYGSVFVDDGLLEEMLTRKGLSVSYDAVNVARREYVSEMFEKPARDLLYVDLMDIAKKLKEHPNPEIQKRAEVISALLHYWLNESKIAADGQFVDYIYSRVTRNTQEEFYWTQPFGTKFSPRVNTRTLAEALIDNGLIDFDNQRVFDVLQQYLNFESTFSTETRFDGSWRKASAVLIRENRGLDRALIHAGEIADSGQPVTLDSIREIQYLLTRNLKKDAGHLRAIDVNIGDVPFEQVRPKLVKWVDALNKSMEAAARGDLNNEALYLEAARLHYELTIIHPFTDGNGRVVRIVSNLVLEKGNKPLFYIPVENKSEYLNYLRTLDKLDPSSPEFTRKMDDFASFLRENSNFSSFEEIASETVTPSLREDIDSYGVAQVPSKTEMGNLEFGGGGDSPIIYTPPKIPITESVASILAPIDPRGYKGVYDWLYHSLYEPSAKLGGQTWGDNANRLSQILNDQISTGARIPQEPFNFYLLGAASSQSVRETAQFVNAVPATTKNLNIVDLSVGGFKRSAQIQSEYPEISMDFRLDDIRSASFPQESADVISADYVFNFIPREQWLSTLVNQRNLLKQDGILAIAFEAKGSGVGASLENFLRQPPRIDEITAILHSAGYEDINVELISKGSVDRYFITAKKGSLPQLSNDLFQGSGGGGAIGVPGFREGEVFGPKGPAAKMGNAVGKAGEKVGKAVDGVREKILPSKITISEPEWNEKTIGIDGLQTEVDNLVSQAKGQGVPPGTKITISYFDDNLKLKTIHTKLETLATAIRNVSENNQFGTLFGELSIKFGNSGVELGSVSNLSDPQNIVWDVRNIPTKAELNYLITHSADFREKVALARDIGILGFIPVIGAAIGVTGAEAGYYYYYKPTTDKVLLKDPEAASRDPRNLPPDDFRCVGNQIVEVSAATGEVLKTLETCQSGCSSGMCQAKENTACQPGERLKVSDSSESCSLSCVDGVYEKDFAQCDAIDLSGISTNRYREVVMRTLSILPDDFFPVEKFDKLSIFEVPLAHFSQGDIGDFSPEVNWRDQETELYGMASISGEHLLIGREVLSEGLVSGVSGMLIHELLHLWASQSIKPLPEGVPYSYVAAIVTETLGGSEGTPLDYPSVTGCLVGGAGSAFHDKPVDGRAVNCGEDFAYAGTQYILEACQLKNYSPERYEYFKNEVFRGKEYIPETGCLSQ